jgi:hypothetical protein
MRRLTLAALLAGCSSAPGTPGPADLIVHHAKVITLDPSGSIAEAFAVRGGRIVAVGRDEEIFRWSGPGTRVIDAEGFPVMPGLYDSHVHVTDAAASEAAGPLPELKSLQDAFGWIREKAATTPEGQWIVLRYAFPTRLKEARFPTRAELDQAAPRHPVFYHAGPAGMVNTAGLRAAAITRDTRNPAGGIVVKDPATGEPTGMLRGSPATALLKLPPAAQATEPQRRAAVKDLMALYNARGLTSIADRDATREDLDLFLSLQRSGELTLRVNVARSFDPSGTREEVVKRLEALPGADGRGGPTGAGDEWVRIGPIKLYLDGGMLNGSAYMREPWPKGPTYQIVEDDYRGLTFIERPRLELVLEEAARRGWQMTAHTAGEAAMDVLLDAYEAVDRRVPIRPLRWCITHANFPSERNLGICRRLDVCADVQPAWLWKDGTTLVRYLGERRTRWFQPYKSWLAATTIGGGSDHMIKMNPLTATNPWDPWLAIWVAVTRKTEGGLVPNPEEALGREDALRLYTINNAYLNREEAEKGSLEPGKLADFIILDRDPLTCLSDDLRRTRILATFVAAHQVYP